LTPTCEKYGRAGEDDKLHTSQQRITLTTQYAHTRATLLWPQSAGSLAALSSIAILVVFVLVVVVVTVKELISFCAADGARRQARVGGYNRETVRCIALRPPPAAVAAPM